MKRMKRIKRDCDADYHASIRLAIKNTPKTVENLHKLVLKGCRTCIEIFLDSPQIKEASFFHDLIRNRAPITDIKDLIETYPDILQLRNVEGESLLEVAVLQGQTEVVQLILDANKESLNGDLLKYAITNRHVDIAKIMVRPEILERFRQSDVESAFKASTGWFSCPEPVFSALLAKMRRRALRETLNLCIVLDNIGAFKAILLHDPALVNAYGPDQEADSKKLSTTPLHLVVNDGSLDLIDFILDNFAKSLILELRDSNGRTAFERALATGVPPRILKRFLDMKPQLIRAVVDTENVFAARLFLQEYGCVAYPKEDIEGRLKLILGMLKCDLDHLEALSNDQEEMANILFDFFFEKDALEIYPIDDLFEITAWSFIRSSTSISDKCLKLFYNCEENCWRGFWRGLIENVLRILKLDEINLTVQGQLINGRYILFWVHQKFTESTYYGQRRREAMIQMSIYTEKIVAHLFNEVFEDEEKLAVYYDLLDVIYSVLYWRIEDYYIPPFVSSNDPNASEKLQIMYKALHLRTPDFNFIMYILLEYEIDKIKDVIKNGSFQLFLAFSSHGQDDLLDYLVDADDDEPEAEKKRQLLPIVEPFLSIENREKLGLGNKPVPLQELARLSVLKKINDRTCYWKRSDFIDRIDKLKLPTLMKNYLLYMDKTSFKIFKN